MYCNLTKNQAFPMAIIRFSLNPRYIQHFNTSNPHFSPTGYPPKPSLNPNYCSLKDIPEQNTKFAKPDKSSAGFYSKSVEMSGMVRSRSVANGFRLRSHVSFSSSTRGKMSFSSMWGNSEEGSVVKDEKTLPWLTSKEGGERTRLGKGSRNVTRSSWEESAKRLDRGGDSSSLGERARRIEKVPVERRSFSREEPSRSFGNRDNRSRITGPGRNRMMGAVKNRPSGSYFGKNRSVTENVEEKDEVEETEEIEVVDDPRWYKIKDRYENSVEYNSRPERTEVRKWNKQEDWGRKTWKEATESTVPKIIGEDIYGVGPVLAALSAGRRDFYALYVQEGLDLSINSKKKKDKKGFEKVRKLAEKLGVGIKEASKHDLNMIVDNRPHQGLVLDASPLEMVKIMELDKITYDKDKNSLWVALDEVTDPQNLGAIIRSAYFFGAAGVVLCAKNSAPLSGVVSKASAGSLELMELRYCKNMMQFLVSSAENGWRVVGGSVSSKAVPLNDVSPGIPTILVMGSEGTGLRPLVERSCTQLVKIPGNNPIEEEGVDAGTITGEYSGSMGNEFWSFMAVESLNVSVAAGVLLHHLIGNSNGKSSQLSDQPSITSSE